MSREPLPRGSRDAAGQALRRPRWVFAYLAGFCAAGLAAQTASPYPIWAEGAPLEAFTACLLWGTGVVSLLIHDVDEAHHNVWLAFSLACALLAIAEMLGLMSVSLPDGTVERTWLADSLPFPINDDVVTVLLWFGTGFWLWLLNRATPFDRLERRVAVAAYALHAMHTILDLGDGEVFTMPGLAVERLRMTEEILELVVLAGYCGALLTLHGTLRDRERARQNGY